MNPRQSSTPNPPPRPAASDPVQRLTVLLVGGRTLVLDLLATGLRLRGDLDVVAATASVPAATSLLSQRPPDLVVIDLPLPEPQLTGLVDALEADPPPRVIAVRGGAVAEQVPQPPHAPCHADAQLHRLGERMLATFDDTTEAAELHLEIDRLLESLGRKPLAAQPQKLLSRRELEVFTRIGRGLMNAGIAAELGISQQTVETHRKSISRKLQATRAELVRLAVLHVVNHGDETAAADSPRADGV
jgi:DNA-binding NarL/FixJ family response regulator